MFGALEVNVTLLSSSQGQPVQGYHAASAAARDPKRKRKFSL
jgi:F0F1-type ATP synthase membrane subunit c/vacuolar-type H+-ATPase subunit K